VSSRTSNDENKGGWSYIYFTFDIGILQCGVGFDHVQHLHNVLHAASELLQFAKDEHFREVEAPVAIGGVEASLGVVERPVVLVVQPQTAVHAVDDHAGS